MMQQTYTRQLIFLIVITVAFLLLIGALVFSEARGDAPFIKHLTLPLNMPDRMERINRFDSDVYVKTHEKMDGDIVVTDGTITIQGEIYGDVIVMYGDIIVEKQGIVYGHAIVYQGKVIKHSGAKIAGDILEMYDGKTRYTSCRDVRGISKSIIHYKERTTIHRREQIDGDVVILKGDLIVDGEVNGDILSISGDVIVRSSGLVIGHVITCNGIVKKKAHARIIGDTVTNRRGKVSHLKSRISRVKHNTDNNDEAIRRRIEKKYLQEKTNKDEDVFRFFGDVTINENEVIHGDVVVMKGAVTIKGEVEGDVLSMFGDVELRSTGYVNGDVTSVGGKIWREDGSHVTGDVLETSMRGIRIKNENHSTGVRSSRKSKKSKVDHEWNKRKKRSTMRDYRDFEDEPVMFRYNRVEGLFFGFRLPRSYWWERAQHNLALYGHLGYGFSNKDLRYQVGLERWFFDDLRFSIGAKVYDLTESQDNWLIPSLENSISSLLIKEDWQDFYRREGYCAYVSQNYSPMFQIVAEYHVDNFYSMTRKTQWALFGGDKKFKRNPAVNELEEFKSAVARLSIDTRNDIKHPDQGWFVDFEGIFAGERLDNDSYFFTGEKVDFDRYILDIRRYQPLGFGENLDFRFRVGSARGELPIQYKFDMGGLSSLRGYDYKYFENGDRLLLGNVEYRIHGHRGYLSDIWWFDDFNIILFSDVGLVWDAEDKSSYQKSFKHLVWSDLRHNIGIAFSNREGNVRLNIARRTDASNQPIVVTFRLNRAF